MGSNAKSVHAEVYNAETNSSSIGSQLRKTCFVAQHTLRTTSSTGGSSVTELASFNTVAILNIKR